MPSLSQILIPSLFRAEYKPIRRHALCSCLDSLPWSAAPAGMCGSPSSAPAVVMKSSSKSGPPNTGHGYLPCLHGDLAHLLPLRRNPDDATPFVGCDPQIAPSVNGKTVGNRASFVSELPKNPLVRHGVSGSKS